MSEPSYKNKKVEDWGEDEYEEFWSNFVEEKVEYVCQICHQPIEGWDICGHMESQHFDYYDKHDQRVTEKRKEWGRRGGKKSRPSRSEKKLTDLTPRTHSEDGETDR